MRAGRVVFSVLVAMLLCVTNVPEATAGEGVAWSREPGGHLSAVTVDAARHIFVTGSIWAPTTGDRRVSAMVVAKYGPKGRLVWRRTWRRGGAYWFALGLSVAPAPGGGVYVGGDSGRYEGWRPVLWRYSATGRLLWQVTLPAPLGRGDMVSIATDATGVVAAVDNSATGGPTAGGNYLYGFDHSGRQVWKTEFAVPGITGTSNWIHGVAIGAGRVYAAGEVSRSPLDARSWDIDVVVQQLSRDGHVRWTRVLGDPGVRDHDTATALDVRSGRVLVTGTIDNYRRGAVWAFTTGGALRWKHRWGTDRDTSGDGVTIAPWGAVYVAANHDVYGTGTHVTRRATLRRYTLDGRFVSKRLVSTDDDVTDVVARGRPYLTVGRSIECVRR
jgi:hypothetical protein